MILKGVVLYSQHELMVSSSTGLLIIFVNRSGSTWPDSLFIFASQSVPQENEGLINPGSGSWACESDIAGLPQTCQIFKDITQVAFVY